MSAGLVEFPILWQASTNRSTTTKLDRGEVRSRKRGGDLGDCVVGVGDHYNLT